MVTKKFCCVVLLLLAVLCSFSSASTSQRFCADADMTTCSSPAVIQNPYVTTLAFEQDGEDYAALRPQDKKLARQLASENKQDLFRLGKEFLRYMILDLHRLKLKQLLDKYSDKFSKGSSLAVKKEILRGGSEVRSEEQSKILEPPASGSVSINKTHCYTRCDWLVAVSRPRKAQAQMERVCIDCERPYIVYQKSERTRQCYVLPHDINSGRIPLFAVNQIKGYCGKKRFGACRMCMSDNVQLPLGEGPWCRTVAIVLRKSVSQFPASKQNRVLIVANVLMDHSLALLVAELKATSWNLGVALSTLRFSNNRMSFLNNVSKNKFISSFHRNSIQKRVKRLSQVADKQKAKVTKYSATKNEIKETYHSVLKEWGKVNGGIAK